MALPSGGMEQNRSGTRIEFPRRKNLPIRFRDEDAARKYLESIRWPICPVCPHCSVIGRASRIEGGRNGLMFCNVCRMQFTVTVGTAFEHSKIPLHTWLYANHLLCSAEKSISSDQLSRTVGVAYKTAWFMSRRIREACPPPGPSLHKVTDPAKIKARLNEIRAREYENLRRMLTSPPKKNAPLKDRERATALVQEFHAGEVRDERIPA